MTASAVSAIARRGATGASLGRCGARSQAASRGWRGRATRARIVGSRAQPMSGEETDMRFGLFTSMGAQTWAGVLDLWRHIEATGWDIACVTDHFMPNTPERERLERLDEACQVLKSLWTQRRSDFQGRYYRLSDAPLDPKPVQRPHPELMIGGGGGRGAPRR